MASLPFTKPAITIGVICFFIDIVIKSHDEEVGKFVAADVYETIHNEFSKLTAVSLTMSNDAFLKQNLQNELNISQEDEIDLMKNFLGDIKNSFGYDTAFVVSAATQNYYYDGGLHKVLDSANSSYDVWYKSFLDKNIPYDISID